MKAVILLSIVIIAGFLFKVEKNQYSRVIIGSVFGIIFFSIWPFTVFYLEIHKLKEHYLILIYGAFSLLAIFISLLLVRIHKELTVASISFISFITLMTLTMSYKNEIKSEIAIYTQYFQKNLSNFSIENKTNDIQHRNSVSKYNYTITLNNKWKKKTEKGVLFEYFLLFDGDTKVAEFRPRCFSTKTISLPDIIKNIKRTSEINGAFIFKRCYQLDKKVYSCKITEKNRMQQIKRVRWFSFDTGRTYGIELDFLTFNSMPSTQVEIGEILDSAKFSAEKQKDYSCLTPVEWM